MAQLAIKGHPTRGKEIIEILKMLGGNKAILEEYLRKVLDWDLIGPSVMGYGLQLHYHITKAERSDVDVKKLTILSPVELVWYPGYCYYDYMHAWGLK